MSNIYIQEPPSNGKSGARVHCPRRRSHRHLDGGVSMDGSSRMSSTPDCTSTDEAWLPWPTQGPMTKAASSSSPLAGQMSSTTNTPSLERNFSLVSFGEEAEEEEEMVTQVSQTLKGKSKSSHDLLKDDPLLSSVPTVNKRKAKVQLEK
ncbi:uncharacterized protein LOC135548214 isoform X2 [Oncorhynchus masou masou]|uniref:uncharacterized protein LOC135548214 isoform X2 n=1 Tax=Oncorhynchus masou masou TaxID=90313 RepID=UPI003182CF7A